MWVRWAIASIFWCIALYWGYTFGDTVPARWENYGIEGLWNISRLFPGETSGKVQVNATIAEWFTHRFFFLVYFACNTLVFALLVGEKKANRVFLYINIGLFILHSLLDSFGLMTEANLSWNSYWIYKVFSFFISPLVPLFSFILYRLSTRLKEVS